jgi:L-ribulose-5-phosphate 4-epimerase
MTQPDSPKHIIVETAQQLTLNGFLIATGGNISLRIPGQNAFAITPSNYDYMKMVEEDVCILENDLTPLEGHLKPSIESGMHATIYKERPDVNAILHTHQVFPSALAILNAPIPALFDEQVRFLGRRVEIIPYAPSGTGMLKNNIARRIRSQNNAYLLQNHGALVFGSDMEQAVHNVEILDKCAQAYLLALMADKKITRIPLPIREIIYAKLRSEQKNISTYK